MTLPVVVLVSLISRQGEETRTTDKDRGDMTKRRKDGNHRRRGEISSPPICLLRLL